MKYQGSMVKLYINTFVWTKLLIFFLDFDHIDCKFLMGFINLIEGKNWYWSMFFSCYQSQKI